MTILVSSGVLRKDILSVANFDRSIAGPPP